MFRITLKNFRCFPDSSPASIDIGLGFTAFIGTNNSGKSTFLRFFNEFKSLFQLLQNSPGPRDINNFKTAHIEDWLEIFNNENQREATIEILDLNSEVREMHGLSVTFQRNQPNKARVRVWIKLSTGQVVEANRSLGEASFAYLNQSHPGDWSKFSDFLDKISNTFYVGPFRNAISEGFGTYFDIAIGTSFISEWDAWKTGSSRKENMAAQEVADDIAHIFDYKRFEINASPDKKSLQVIINGKPYRLRELGAGIAQFIIVFGNVSKNRPALLLIDEPELNLHPSLQIDFLTSLASYTSYGVIFASHSVGLARAVSDRIFTFQKKNDYGTVKPFEQTPNFAEFIGEMSFSSFQEIGCDRIILVEGVTEVKAIQQFLRHLRKDHTTVLLPLGGSQLIRGGVQLELNELKRISNNIAVLIDSERDSDVAPLSKERTQFIADCSAIGFKTHVTKLRAFENYLSEDAIKAEKGDSFKALEPYQKLSQASQGGWAKADNWRIARKMTRDDVLNTDIGQFLEAL